MRFEKSLFVNDETNKLISNRFNLFNELPIKMIKTSKYFYILCFVRNKSFSFNLNLPKA